VKQLVIFSHGFGVDKTDRGLFSDIAADLGAGFEYVMFDYNLISSDGQTMTVRPLSEQVKILQQELSKAKVKNPDARITIIGHSQGGLVAALAQPAVDKVIMLATAMDFNIDRLVQNFTDRPGVEINLHAVSKLMRRDGTTTLIGPQYVKEIQAVDPVLLYNRLAGQTDLIMVRATQDEVIGEVSYDQIKAAKVIDVPADHNFTGAARQKVIAIIENELL
jgi:pimeloyl-ACP methyl ester carboxylesterase